MELKELVAQNIRKMRLERELTQGELAKLIKSDVRFVNQLEKNPQNVTLHTLEKIAKAFKISPYQLLFDLGTSSSKQAKQLEELGLLAAKRLIEEILAKRVSS